MSQEPILSQHQALTNHDATFTDAIHTQDTTLELLESPSPATERPAPEAENSASRTEGDNVAPTATLDLPPVRIGLSFSQRCTDAVALAQEGFSQTGSWVVFYREILGYKGIVRQLFKTPAEMREFEETNEFGEILEMASAIRSQDSGKGDEYEPQKMITVRLPRSQHETLKLEAAEHRTSINKLCISKLLLGIEGRLVPTERGKVRGRKPGPQSSDNKPIDLEATH